MLYAEGKMKFKVGDRMYKPFTPTMVLREIKEDKVVIMFDSGVLLEIDKNYIDNWKTDAEIDTWRKEYKINNRKQWWFSVLIAVSISFATYFVMLHY